MDSVSIGWHLEVPRKGTGESILGTRVGELLRDGWSRHVVRVEWAGALTFGNLNFNLRGSSDARHVDHPREGHGIGHCPNGE